MQLPWWHSGSGAAAVAAAEDAAVEFNDSEASGEGGGEGGDADGEEAAAAGGAVGGAAVAEGNPAVTVTGEADVDGDEGVETCEFITRFISRKVRCVYVRQR